MTRGTEPIRIVHIITDLFVGGAEGVLCNIVLHMSSRFQSSVISLRHGGKIARLIKEGGIPVLSPDMPPALPGPVSTWRLVRMFRQLRPHIIQGWMYHGNLAATFGSRFINRPVPVIWNVRGSLSSLAHEKPLSAMTIRLCAYLSRHPAAVLYNSAVSARQHREIGYSPDHERIIRNGIDTRKFRPDPEAPFLLRNKLGIPRDSLLIGMFSRSHPSKSHGSFIEACASLRKSSSPIHLVLGGHKIDSANSELMTLIRKRNLEGQTHLLGERTDIASLLPAMDIVVSTSTRGEAFPNIIGEAMACGVPCIATHLGDTDLLIGDTGKIVSPSLPDKMSEAIQELIDAGKAQRKRLGEKARMRIETNFSLDHMINSYENLYDEISAMHSAY